MKKALKPLLSVPTLASEISFNPMLSGYSLPPSIYKVSGAIGKKYVIKQYKKGQVVTRYPDMSGIVPSTKQKVRRRLFARAVRYAQSIYWKPELKRCGSAS
jgi:hypothetical protein